MRFVWPFGLAFVLAGIACSAPRFDPPNPHSFEAPPMPARRPLPQARISRSATDAPQKLQFIHRSPVFDDIDGIWKERYFVLPALWNAFHNGCTADSCEGTIELPDGRRVRWFEGYVGSDLSPAQSNVVWKRTEPNPAIIYGVVRQGRTERFEVMIQNAGPIVFRSSVTEQRHIDELLAFVRSFTATPAPCADCVEPIFRK